MSDRPIIFSGAMVRALLDGRKTQTRRLAWHEPTPNVIGTKRHLKRTGELATIWQRVEPGDRLWVRENMRLGATSTAWCYAADDRLISLDYPDHRVAQMVGWAHHQERASVPSIHMPRWASRLTLTVTDVRRQRLQEITEADATAEGVDAISMADVPRQAAWSRKQDFSRLWDTLHGIGAWDANPEIVALAFTVARANIDAKEAA